ncbi:MAG: formaldehyde activating enzyme [Methanohalophilus sp. T328-1]|jgi:5,6,7,8-tetrahydromethanopterin hydro-lyase|nr:MAG: formaldehyde activating enzyme [Methanohalophilus sp. T328-1]
MVRITIYMFSCLCGDVKIRNGRNVLGTKNHTMHFYKVLIEVKEMTKILNSLVGEALVGEGPEVAHIDLVIGRKGSAVETAFMNSLAMPRQGHSPLLAVLEPNVTPKPATLLVNKVTMKNVAQASLMFGPAQASIAKAVMDSVDEGVIPKEEAEDLLIIVSVFIEWDAKDKDKIYEFNYEATKLAIKRAVDGTPTVDEALAKKDSAAHPFA